MKRIILLSFLFISFAGFSQDQQDAKKYVLYYADMYNALTRDVWSYTKAVSRDNSVRKHENTKVELGKAVHAALEKAKGSEGFDGDTDFKEVVVNYLESLDILFQEDYPKIEELEAGAKQSFEKMEAYITACNQASNKQLESLENLIREENIFANGNDVEMNNVLGSIQKEMFVMTAVLENYNATFLMFFKSNKLESDLLDTHASLDLDKIKEVNERFKSSAEDGLENLQNVELIEDDKTLLSATNEVLKFYLKEAGDTQVIIDYITKSKAFKKVKENFDAIKEKDRTQEDVDRFNAAVEKMNGATEKYNAVNEANNKQRMGLIDQWNSTASGFLKKHAQK